MQLHIQPAAAPSHVTVQTAILTLNGTAQSPVSIPIGAADFVLGPVSETDSGSVSLVYANALGVVGPAESLDFSVANMLPVPQPAAFTLKVTADPAPMVPTPAPLSPLA